MSPRLAALAALVATATLASLSGAAASADECPHGVTTGHVAVMNPWTLRDDAQLGIVVDDVNFFDESSEYITVTGPTGTFDLHQPLKIKLADLQNGTYTLIGHWQVPCQDSSGQTVPAESPPLQWQVAIPPLQPTHGIFTDPNGGRKYTVAAVVASEYCDHDANTFKDEPFTLTAYYTTNGRLPTTTSKHFTDGNAHGCSIEQNKYKRHLRSVFLGHGLSHLGGDAAGDLEIVAYAPLRLRALIVERSGGLIVDAMRVRFFTGRQPIPGPVPGNQPAEWVRADRGSCPSVPCSSFHKPGSPT